MTMFAAATIRCTKRQDTPSQIEAAAPIGVGVQILHNFRIEKTALSLSVNAMKDSLTKIWEHDR